MANTLLNNPIFYIFIFNIICLIALGIYYYRSLRTIVDVINIQDKEISDILHQLVVLRTLIAINHPPIPDDLIPDNKGENNNV